MFKSKSTKNHEQAVALVGMVSALAASAAGSKGRGAERLEALAQVVAAFGFDPESIQSIEIDWKTIKMDGDDELVPVLKMTAADGSKKEFEQTNR